jgi:hypothetical protein
MAQINTPTNALQGATIPTNVGNYLRLMIATARNTPQAEGNLTTLFQNDPLPNHMGTSWNSTKFGTLTAFSLQAGVDMTQQQALTGTNVSVTPAEVGVQIVLTRKGVAQWNEDTAERAGVAMRNAMDRKKDTDIGGLFSGFSRRVGAAAAVFSMGHIGAGISRLAGGANTTGAAIVAGTGVDVNDGPFFFVVRPESVHHLLRSVIGGPGAAAPTVGTTSPTLSAGGLGEEKARVGQAKALGEINGATGYRNANLAKDTSDDVSGFIGEKGAIVYVPMSYEGLGAGMKDPDVSLRAFEINMVEDYGFAELDDNKGVELLLDATPATS